MSSEVRDDPVTDIRQKLGKKFETDIMARTVREANLGTRSPRLRLAVVSKPYWRVLKQGLHLGYRRRATGGTWIARRRSERGTYHEAKLGLADDLQDANGQTVFDFTQAQRAARTWCANELRLRSQAATR